MTTMTRVEAPSRLMETQNNLRLPRVAFYSHDTQGLGHIRRNLAIATALQHGAAPPVTLLISGTQIGSALGKPAGIDFLTLPAVAKDANGCYYAHSLALSLDEIIHLRATTIQSALTAFAPDVATRNQFTRASSPLAASASAREPGLSCIEYSVSGDWYATMPPRPM